MGENKKFCPMLAIGKITCTNSTSPYKCMGKDCAWYVEKYNVINPEPVKVEHGWINKGDHKKDIYIDVGYCGIIKGR